MLRFDYDRLREPCLILEGDTDLSEQISELQVLMLRDNEIPGVMPAILDSEANAGRFRCYLQGRQPIMRMLARSGLTLELYFSLLHEITSILTSARSHMLLERNFLLEEEVIFEQAGIPQLVYLPFAVPYTEDIGEALLRLAVRWTAYLRDSSGRGIAELLALLQSPGCTAETVNKRLAQLRHEAANQQEDRSDLSAIEERGSDRSLSAEEGMDRPFLGSSILTTTNDQQAGWMEQGLEISDGGDAASQRPMNGFPLASDNDPFLQENGVSGDEEAKERVFLWRERGFWVRMALTAVILLILWQVFWWKPTELTLYGCLGAGVAVILLLFGKQSRRRSRRFPLSDAEEERWERVDAALSEEEYYEQLPQQTVVLPNEEAVERMERKSGLSQFPQASNASSTATVVLAPEEWMGAKPQLVLHQQSGRGEILHTIDKSGTVLGRSSEEAEVWIDEPGISSTHVEFQYGERGWSMQDLASRNGTKVNGEWVVPFKPVTLQAGDCIELPGIILFVKDLNAGYGTV